MGLSIEVEKTAHMKKLLYAAFLINLFIILFFWWQNSGSLFSGQFSDPYLALGRLSGLLAVYFVLLQFVLRGRAVWIEETFGLNNLSTVHRLNGYLSFSFIVLHMFFILASYSMNAGTDGLKQLILLITTFPDLLQAFAAVILFIVIVVFSIYIVRRKLKYEMWYYIHLLTYLTIVLAWGHQLKFGGDFVNKVFVVYWYILYAFVFGNLLLFRFDSYSKHILFWNKR